MPSPQITFWYEFASTYSYLSVMRIETLAADANIAIRWRPFLLGPIFQAQGWATSPFNLFPAKGRYMVRDIDRIAGERGLAFRLPEPFPANSLHAARLACVGLEAGWTPAFTKALFHAEFAEGADISQPAVLDRCLAAVGADPDAANTMAISQPVKQTLRANTDEAARLGVFGAPTFVTPDGEMFWGDDRLEIAMRWTAKNA